MSSILNQLNLRPQEKRLLVIVATVVFVVLNIWFVWPLFDDWKQIRAERHKAEQTLALYQREIARIPVYEARLKELESAGSFVIPEEQDLNLALAVDRQAVSSGLTINRNSPRSSSLNTNEFFEEKAVEIQVSTGNQELVQFLVNLASTNSLIRVQNLTLRPAAGSTRLDGTITLIASYQKKPPTGAGAAAATPATTGSSSTRATSAPAGVQPTRSLAASSSPL